MVNTTDQGPNRAELTKGGHGGQRGLGVPCRAEEKMMSLRSQHSETDESGNQRKGLVYKIENEQPVLS